MSLLSMSSINKSFGEVQVLKNIGLTVEKGEVHALLGENGAGKSTLMNILTGVHTKDSGKILYEGKELENITVHESEKLGIAFVHQELNLFNTLRVFENMFLCKEYNNKFGKLDKKRMINETRALFEKLDVDIDPLELVGNLKTSQKQLLEISKALLFDARLLILDEPTTALNNEEVAHLFGLINDLKKEGKSFIFISHKMPEIFELADRYTVFRNGEFICDGNIKDTNAEAVTREMVGKSLSSEELYSERDFGDVLLKIEGLTGDGFNDVNLEVRKGQIIGLTGLQGAGSSELMQCIFGVSKPISGKIEVHGKEINSHSIKGAMRNKIGMLAANRKENSVLKDMNLLENMYISEQVLSGNNPHISNKNELQKYDKFKELLSIKANSPKDAVTSLSGGNQQKIFIARWLNTEAEILLFDNPTQGIDVGAKEEIYKLILSLAESGKTILINTLEIPELQKVADKCAVFYNGGIIKMLDHKDIDETTVMLYSTNAMVERG